MEYRYRGRLEYGRGNVIIKIILQKQKYKSILRRLERVLKMAKVAALDGQMSFSELFSVITRSPNTNELRNVGDLIGRRVLGEVRTARIIKIEGLPNFPFYRTDSGVCYNVKEGRNSIEELETQAVAERVNYKTIVPENLTDRITWQYTRRCDNRPMWAQIGIVDGMLFWKDAVTYQFLEPYDTPEKLKRAYNAKKKEIEYNTNISRAEIVPHEHLMRRLYWSRHGFYADAEYVETNG